MPSGTLKTSGDGARSKKAITPWFIGGNLLGFGLLVLLLLVLVNRTSNPTDRYADLRSSAGEAKGIPVVGLVVSTDALGYSVTVDSMKMANSDAQLPGSWTATVDPATNFSTLTPGARVVLDIDPPTFSVENHTFRVFSVEVTP